MISFYFHVFYVFLCLCVHVFFSAVIQREGDVLKSNQSWGFQGSTSRNQQVEMFGLKIGLHFQSLRPIFHVWLEGQWKSTPLSRKSKSDREK